MNKISNFLYENWIVLFFSFIGFTFSILLITLGFWKSIIIILLTTVGSVTGIFLKKNSFFRKYFH
ncbi:DUF2273 domain-containing protein [Apilactobacillus kunkeei]|uniref:DUF2273 domain-containing protein n=1 Tax=Apilactobacillus kunkeei TaxID=148814 RepID=UPI001C8A7C0A|nr:DUF2273 domain-containing protein [Apilactobacillus kunkeei]MBX8456267.1 DUF2273 domain-containing protein [Apilactobacillus kunkeei]